MRKIKRYRDISIFTRYKILVTYRTILKLDISHCDILYQTGVIAADQTTDQTKIYYNTVLLWYIWERLFDMYRGIVYILRTFVRQTNRYISSIHKLLIKSTFSKYFTINHPKTPLRYLLRQNPVKSSISLLFKPSKIIKITSKIPSKPWKIRFLSNLIKIFKKILLIIQNNDWINLHFSQQN